MANTTNFGWETPDDTDLVKDGAAAMRTLGNAIDASLVDLKGGTTGQVLSKNTNTDMDFVWTTPQTGDITAVTAGTGLSGGGTSGDVTLTNTVATTFDAKGDLVVGTGADTFAKLVAGSNGDTLVADSSQTTGLRYNPPAQSLSNLAINGGFDVWQRGTSVSIAASSGITYTADRWATVTGANQAITISRQTTSDTTNLPNIQFAARVQRNNGQTGTGGMAFAQAAETTNSIPYSGKIITMTFYARRGANFSGTFRAVAWNGTGTDQTPFSGMTGQNLIAYEAFTLTTSWQRFATLITVPANSTQLAFGFDWTPSGTAGANDWYEVTGVQIDVGNWTASTAPTFRRAGNTLAGELAACQRYYYRLYPNLTNKGLGVGFNYSTTASFCMIPYPVTMRIRPTALEQSGTASHYSVLNSSASQLTCTAVPTYDAWTTTAAGWINSTVSTGLTAGNGTFFNALTADAYLGWSAEL